MESEEPWVRGEYQLDGRPYCVKWSPDGALLAVGDDDSRVHIVGPTVRTVSSMLNDAAVAADALPTLALSWRPDAGAKRRRLVLLEANCAGWLNHWHVPSRRRLHSLKQATSIHCVDYASGGWAFATSGKDANVRVYEEATKSELLVFRGGEERGSLREGHVQQVFSLRFHDANPQLLASAGWDKVVHFWDMREGRSVGSFSGPFVAGDSIDLHGNDLLAGSSHGRSEQVLLFDLRKPGAEPTFKLTIEPAAGSHDDPYILYACRFSRDSARSLIGVGCGASGTGDGVVKVYDRARGAFVESVELRRQSVYSIDFAPPDTHPMRLAYAAGSRMSSSVRVIEVCSRTNT